MAISQSTALLNLGADAAKAAANSASQNSLNTGITLNSGEQDFAKTLRKQLDNKAPTNPVSQQAKPLAAQAKALPPGQSVRAQTPAGAKDPAPAVKDNNASPANQPVNSSENTSNTDNASASAADTTANSEATSEHSTNQASQAGDSSASDTVRETAQERKKRLLLQLAAEAGQATPNGVAATDASGLTPWMQSMLAMRQSGQAAESSASSDTSNTLAVTPDAALAATLTKDASAVDPVTEATAGLSTDPLAAGTTADGKDKALNLGRLMRDAVKEGLPPGRAEGLLAQADKGGQAAAALASLVAPSAEKAFGEVLASVAGQDTAAVTTPTPTQLTSASAPPAWMQAAGLTQTPAALSQINTPFGNERWQAAMNQHVMNMVGAGDEVASLTLSPPDLGPIQVVLKVDNQSVNTSFISDNPLVRQALEDGMQDLRERMQTQGLQLGQTFIGNGQQAQQHFEQASPAPTSAVRDTEATLEASAPTTVATPRVARGLVDTFV